MLDIQMPIALPIAPAILSGVEGGLAAGGRWWHPGTSLDMDFARGRIYGAPSFASALSVTRASAGYAQRADGSWQLFAPGEPRIVDGRGMLVEEARQNYLNNNGFLGAVPGSPGTMPTGYYINLVPAGMSREVVGIGTIDGMDYLDVRIFGTAGSSGECTIGIPTGSVVSTAEGDTFTLSIYLAIVGGSLAGTFATRLRVVYYLDGAYKRDSYATLSPTGNIQRFTRSSVTTSGENRVQGALSFMVTGGQTIDLTARLLWPQLEKGAFATSPIRTTGSAATRAADVVTLNNPMDYVSLGQGSIFTEWAMPSYAAGSLHYLWSMRVDGSNVIRFPINTAGQPGLEIVADNVTTVDARAVNSVQSNITYKGSVRWKENDCAARFSASLGNPANDLSSVMPTGTPAFALGSNNSSGLLNGYLRRLALFQTPQNDAQLEALVA